MSEPGKVKDTECGIPLYLHVYAPPAHSPAPKTRSVAQMRCVCGASVQPTSPEELREPSVRARVTAGLISAVPSNQVLWRNSNKILGIFIHSYILSLSLTSSHSYLVICAFWGNLGAAKHFYRKSVVCTNPHINDKTSDFLHGRFCCLCFPVKFI